MTIYFVIQQTIMNISKLIIIYEIACELQLDLGISRSSFSSSAQIFPAH